MLAMSHMHAATIPTAPRLRPAGRVLAVALVLACAELQSGFAADRVPLNAAGEVEFEGQSEYSHIRIRRRGPVRSMLFVRDSGEEALETQIDVRKPYVLRFEYLEYMFTSYLLRPEQREVLLVGLGGGGMIHFLKRTDPQVRIDAVEIDPLVVKLANKYFDVRSEGTVQITTADGFKYIAETPKQYDAIYMDAFLKPSADTDGTGAPLALRTRQFYKQLQQKLKPGGVVAFNLNPHPRLNDDVRAIEEAFPQVYVFPLTQYGGAVVLASTEPARVKPAEFVRRGQALDRRFRSTVRFQEMARRVQP